MFSFSLVRGLYSVCHGLFALPLGVIGKISLIMALPGHLYYCVVGTSYSTH